MKRKRQLNFNFQRSNKKEFVILPYEDFLKLQEELACYKVLTFCIHLATIRS